MTSRELLEHVALAHQRRPSGVHAGRLRAWGRAPDDVHWELGVRADGVPLARLRGDRYEVADVGGVSRAA